MKDTPNASKSDHQEEVAKSSDRVGTDRSVQALPTTDSTPVIVAAQPNLKNGVIQNSDPLKEKSLFGFAVVKRSNLSAVAVGKKPHIDPKPTNQQPNDVPEPIPFIATPIESPVRPPLSSPRISKV